MSLIGYIASAIGKKDIPKVFDFLILVLLITDFVSRIIISKKRVTQVYKLCIYVRVTQVCI